MSSTVGVVLAAIAAVVATFGYILFGKPKAEETRTVAPTEKVLEPTVPAPKVPEPKWVESSIPAPIADASVDPWDDATPDQTSTGALTLDTVKQVEGVPDKGSSDDIPVELNLDDATQVNESDQSLLKISTARYGASSIEESSVQSQVFVAIRDPNCPPPESQELSQQILAWGESGTAENLKTVLSYAQNPEAVIRRYVAVAIGQVATKGTIGSDIQSAVPVLETLTLDSDAKVQKIAAKSLKVIQG
jgi:hypothetical protein